MLCIGIDIGGQSVKSAGFENESRLWTGQSRPYSRPTTAELLIAIRESLKSPARNSTAAIGLCVPGILDQSQRMITLSVNVPGLMGIALDDLVADATGVKPAHLSIINDAVAAAVDIVHTERLSGRVICIALGTGVGMGVLDDGKTLHVEGTSPGHIGQVDVSIGDDAPIGPDGGAGSLEAYIGAAALVSRYGSTEKFLLKADASAPPLLALARAIRICHALYRPNHVVLAGGIGIRLKRLIPQIKSRIDTHLTSVARTDWTLGAGEHDFHAAVGAARLAAAASGAGGSARR